MSIIKAVQDFLCTYKGMDLQEVEVEETEAGPIFKAISAVLTDRTDEGPSSYALQPTGNSVTRKDILGNKTYEHDYVFYAKEAAGDEVDRQDNYSFMEGLFSWLEDQDEAGNFPELPTGYTAEGLTVANIILFELEERVGLYQVQIKLRYRKENPNG
ncbi:hypothetical protein Ami103574_02575 [Aminipila butyrica]|uniref:Chloramphenicol resistance protein n=1 Tax=Aminipila butyrica TaxID=433296 RepID=A0A858BT37_9FIRM|nr:hypothetical protein [Aminipila butyrica]QIB68265.1 hypothetical protein Ami103574_02575 [Aminipila butyrica]